MRKDDIVNELSKTMLDRAAAAAALDKVFEIIKTGIKKDGKAVISNFGSFNLVRQRAVVRHNPKTMQKVSVPEKMKVRFKPSDNILD